MRILVTGGLGFVGSAVSARLADAGHRVVALARTPRADQPPHPAVQVVYGDLLDAERVDEIIAAGGFDGVCHLAGRVRVRESFADPAGYWQANVNGIANLLAALARATERSGQPVRLVFASAGAIYGSGHEKPISEEATPNPTSPYAASKLAAEQLLGWQAATGVLGAVSLRCLVIAGATGGRVDGDRSRLLPQALAVAAGLERALPVNGDGSAVREFTHVADVADAYRLALAAAQPGRHEIFNVGSGCSLTVRELLATVERVTGRSVSAEHRSSASEPQTLVLDSRRIRQQLGWEPRRSIEDMVRDAWSCLEQ